MLRVEQLRRQPKAAGVALGERRGNKNWDYILNAEEFHKYLKNPSGAERGWRCPNVFFY